MSVTGEDETGLRKILDMTRFAGIFILLLHFYYFCYAAFKEWGFSSKITDRLLMNTIHTRLFNHLSTSKLIALGLLVISLIGATGRKDEKLRVKTIVTYLTIGLILYL